jgi:hypothetical protein
MKIIALHPLVRIQINAPFFSRAVLVSIKKFLSPVEIARNSATVSDRIRTMDAKLLFKSIQLCTPYDSSSWRSPNTAVSDSLHLFPTEDSSDVRLSTHLQKLSEFPIDIGSIVSIPGSKHEHYRIDLGIHNRYKNIENSFLFVSSLSNLYNSIASDEDNEFDEILEIVQVEKTTGSRTLPRLLPQHTTCLPSIVRLAHDSVRGPNVLIH